jgi:hypothetical protein
MENTNMKKWLYLLIIFILTSIAVMANPIHIHENLFGNDADLYRFRHTNLFIFLGVVVALSLEYLVIRLLFGRKLTIKQTFLAFIGIHLISYPITLFFSSAFGYYAEIIPLIIEPKMYNYVLKGYFNTEIQHVLLKVIIANLISFAVGIYIFKFLVHEIIKGSIFNYF